MSERSPSVYPSYKPDPVTAWMSVAGSGSISRKATLEARLRLSGYCRIRRPPSRTRPWIPISEMTSVLSRRSSSDAST